MFSSDHRKPACFRLLALVGAITFIGLTMPAVADEATVATQLKKIASQLEDEKKHLAEQELELKRQQQDLAAQAALIASQRDELARLRGESPSHAEVTTIDATGNPPVRTIDATENPGPITGGAARANTQEKLIPRPPTKISSNSSVLEKPNFLMPLQYSQNQNAEQSSSDTPATPVGEAPQENTASQGQANEVVQSLPVGLAVLTPPQHFIFTPGLEYTQTTNNQFVYEGVAIIPGINIGQITATTDDRSIISAVADIRYGVFDHLEVEARVPYTFAEDRATVLSQGPNSSGTQSLYLSKHGVGDIQFAGRYQINDGLDDWPVFVANAVVKTDTGLGPYDVAYNSAGVAEGVAIGSGFWALQGGFSILKVSDPAILYASANYIYQIPKDINKTIGGEYVGNVDPSNAVSAAFGFGFAVNSTFSFSLGYEHSYVFPQETEVGGMQQSTTSLEVGALTFGIAYRLAPNVSLNSNFEFGVTHDAPNMHWVLTLPISF